MKMHLGHFRGVAANFNFELAFDGIVAGIQGSPSLYQNCTITEHIKQYIIIQQHRKYILYKARNEARKIAGRDERLFPRTKKHCRDGNTDEDDI
jgi:hypothetical protein